MEFLIFLIVLGGFVIVAFPLALFAPFTPRNRRLRADAAARAMASAKHHENLRVIAEAEANRIRGEQAT